MVVRWRREIAALVLALAWVPGCTCVTLPEGVQFHCDTQVDCTGDLVCIDGWCALPDGGFGGGAGGSGGSGGGGGGGTGGTGGAGGTGGGGLTQLTFTPTEDATIEQEVPDMNYGADPTIQVDLTPVRQEALIKFAVNGVAGRTVVSALLRLYCVNSSGAGGEVRLAANNLWAESGVTWNNAPAAGALVATLPAVDVGIWYDVDVSSAIAKDGTFSFRMVPLSDDGADYETRESTHPIELVLTVQ